MTSWAAYLKILTAFDFLKLLKRFGNDGDGIKRMYYLCTVKIIGRLKDVAATSGIFLCHQGTISVRNRVGKWKHPKASLDEPDSA